MASSVEPQRVYLYDFTNNRPVVDYSLDQNENTFDGKKSKFVFDGLIRKDPTSKRGTTYKVRITNQIRNLINNKDSVNVKLGLVITENIATSGSYKVRNASSAIKQIPRAAVSNPLGTILFGGNSSVSADKRLKLEIFFTKPN